MKLYAVIDTNVLVSAMIKWDSVPGSICQGYKLRPWSHSAIERFDKDREMEKWK